VTEIPTANAVDSRTYTASMASSDQFDPMMPALAPAKLFNLAEGANRI
jgi:hypothetical protein